MRGCLRGGLSWFFCLVLLVPFGAHAASAVRLPGESPERAALRAFEAFARTEPEAFRLRGASAWASAKPFAEIDFRQAPTVSDYGRLFVRLRDERFQKDPDKNGFVRRISWLYPHDGCFTRAAVASRWAEEHGWRRPANFFAFGSLRVATKNAPAGEVSWWYHVAPLVNDRQGKAWVLDPAMDPKGPLAVEDWLKRMAGSLSNVKVALCSPYNWEPYRACDEATTANQANMAARQMNEFLPAERRNLIALKRNPDLELGDSPPWIE